MNSVGNNTFQNQNLFGFDEQQDIDPIDFLNLGLGISLPTNIRSLASHYIFYDPIPQTTLLGSIEFANTIIAVITARTALMSSEALGDPSVTYLYPSFVGLELRDRVTFQGNTAFLDWRAGTPGDYIRVITAELQTSTPEPNTFILLSLGVVGLGLCRKRRKQRES